MIRCGRLAVEGEDEEEEAIAVSPIRISKPRQRVGKASNNPYSSRGLDEFARLTDELSAKREYYASKTGTPLELVRFVRSSRGWKPVAFKNGGHGSPDRVFILPPNRSDGNRGDGNDIGRVLILPPNTQLDNEKTYNVKNKFENEADIFLRRRKASSGDIDATAIACAMIVVLFFLVFYGKLPAVCLTTVWWYVLPIFRTKVAANTPHNGNVNLDLQSRDYKKKIHH